MQWCLLLRATFKIGKLGKAWSHRVYLGTYHSCRVYSSHKKVHEIEFKGGWIQLEVKWEVKWFATRLVRLLLVSYRSRQRFIFIGLWRLDAGNAWLMLHRAEQTARMVSSGIPRSEKPWSMCASYFAWQSFSTEQLICGKTMFFMLLNA